MTELTRYKKYKESYQTYYKVYSQANREKILARQHEWRRTHPNYHRDWEKAHPNRHKEYFENHREARNVSNRKWRRNNAIKKKAGNLISNHPKRYPLADRCEFCGSTDRLEHGHIDYDYPELYLTVCRACNYWMDRPMTEDVTPKQ